MTHTATPWYISADKRKIMAKNKNQQAQDITISNLTALDIDNAEFIVRACNAHDDLVKALSDMIISCESARGMTAEVYFNAHQALAKAIS